MDEVDENPSVVGQFKQLLIEHGLFVTATKRPSNRLSNEAFERDESE